MSRIPTKLRRRIERALLGELSAADRTDLFTTLRGDPVARAEYDRAASALRVLEGDAAVAPFEIDLVESWLVADLEQVQATSPTRALERLFGGWRTWMSLAFAAAAAILVVLLTRTGPGVLHRDDDGAFTVKGPGRDAVLAIDALCGTDRAVAAAGGDALVSASSAGCDRDDTLAFSLRVAPGHPGVVSLFGVDSDGDRMYYAPTPDDPHAVSVKPGAWRPVGAGVKLSVNHAPGPVRVYAVLAPRAATVQEVDALATALADASPAVDGSPSWIDRLLLGASMDDRQVLRGLCPSRSACHAAELDFVIRPGGGAGGDQP